ncbi:serine/threonine-protein kinase [Frigoriglobus tundricola]|uniref:Protein kinase domain-containing protein n=1 Tax=Frigoriglobus tundricola TaxID=2774151 RepID=A0A6M5YWR1_9BACT|nr:serine/threonine-protein kinase [Frigoriglobus tundricola]QJW97731.1 hypothetical protein FTUN_5309 [Frigoriglobus tundricola]
MHSDDRDPVDVLAEEFADRLRRGEHPSVSAYAAAHPDHADQLKELLPAVAQMELLKRFRHPVAAEASLPDRLGDFRIVRELGRGGMGVVFEAVQESLGRPVALKVLARHAQLDPVRRERFVREAQTAAKLHHTNIVPVFGVGEQDGLPYYVMQLIPGCGLHAIVWEWRQRAGRTGGADRETLVKNPDTKPAGASGGAPPGAAASAAPPYGNWRFVAGAGLQVAYALHYAHRQGVLHRDVKPANLILDGETVWVTDFGLAKLMNTDGLTATGDILGTLQYLPPECLVGDAGPRSDVYGLGATLYELLTLEPPYAADSPAKLVRLVADTDPRPPRELNPDIPRDLETIVLKAMAREPGARYATARDMAEDLDAFLEDRPIKARRTSPVVRAWRWCRRNPAVASLALSTVIALTLATAAGWAAYARTNEALDRESALRKAAEDAKTDAQHMSDRLEANLQLSLDTVNKVFVAAGGGRQGFGAFMSPLGGPGRGPGGPDRGPGGPPGGPDHGPNGGPAAESASDKAAILDAVLDFYDKFAEQTPPDPELQFEAAKASRRVCEVYVWLRRPEKAVAAFGRAVGLLEPLVKRFPGDDAKRSELVMAYLIAPPEAYPVDREAGLRRADELAREHAWLTGLVQFRTGLNREQAGDRRGAETAYRTAVGALASVAPAARPMCGQLDLAVARLRLAATLKDRDARTARMVLEQSVADLKSSPSHGEGPSPELDLLSFTYRELSQVCTYLDDPKGAKEAESNSQLYGGFGRPGGFGGHGGKKDGFGGKKDGFGGGKRDWPPKN